MRLREIGERVTVRGETYRIHERRPAGEGKFFGRYVWLLRRESDGMLFRAYGKTVTGNSRLTVA